MHVEPEEIVHGGHMRHPRRSGFSLVELLVVLGIIAVLAAILLPSLRSVRERAKGQACAGNLRQIGFAITAYGADNDGQLPPYAVSGSLVPATWLAIDSTLVYGCSWYHEPILGQYVELKTAATLLSSKVNQVAKCPSSRFTAANNQVTASLGLNVTLFPQVNAAGTWPATTLQRLNRPLATTVAGIDGMERFHPGYGSPPPTFGVSDTDPGLNWSIGSSLSVFNWRKRHNGGANILYFDGHVAGAADPRQLALSRTSIFN
jgi:prepilin-type processing-associated H-X9-DG protein/prepilin-type N-terminal cleavage/methylation domain-containing protein